MDFKTKVRALFAVGLGNAARSVMYSRVRRAADRRFGFKWRKRGMVQAAPGKLQETTIEPWGGVFQYEFARLEVRFAAADIVRVTWTPGKLPVAYSVTNDRWDSPSVAAAAKGKDWTLRTSEVSVVVGADGSIQYDAGEMTLRKDMAPVRHGDKWTQVSRMRGEERVYGLGERTAPFNLRPGLYRTWNTEPMGAFGPGDDPIYFCVPAYMGLHDDGSYVVFYDNSHEGRFEFEHDATVSFSRGALRYYFMPGPPQQALQRYASLTGLPAMPPRWALGYHQSRWSYESEAEVRELVAGFQQRDLPLQAVHLDIHYMDEYRVFTVDKTRFPDLTDLCRDLDKQGVKVVTIIDPGVKIDEQWDLYQEGLQREAYIRYPDGELVTAPVWPGWCAFPDFSNPAVRMWWGQQYKKIIDWGVAGVWHDMNEPAAFASRGDPTLPLSGKQYFEGQGGDHSEGHNLYALQEAMAGYAGLAKHRPQRRPWILTRSGWAGIQRYAWNWSGDTESTWWTLGQSVRIALSMGLSGMPFTGPDIGGFSGKPSPEMYARWFQLGSFLPFFRTHSASFTDRREPWLFGDEVLGVVRDSLQTRVRLMPYLYTLAWQTSTTGLPLVRPMFFEDPVSRDWWDVDDQFMLGDCLLVAPILEEGQSSRDVRFPAGLWYDFRSGNAIQGPTTISVDAPLDVVPVFVRGGSVLPLAPDGQLALHAYPDAQGGATGVLYSDDGDGYGEHCVSRFAVDDQGILDTRREGDYDPGFTELRLVVHG